MVRGLRIAVALSGLCVVAMAQDRRDDLMRAVSRPLVQGSIVYRIYCERCHGHTGDGITRAARLYGDHKLAIKPQSSDYYTSIIHHGSEELGASRFMPPWRDELSRRQIVDTAAYLAVLGDPVQRGEAIFIVNCARCHGIHADGKGHVANALSPRPADLTHSTKDTAYKERIVRSGGAAMRRSSGMPRWDGRLTDNEIKDVVEYLRSIAQSSH